MSEIKIKPITQSELGELSTIQEIFLNCILMENNEVIFCGKSFGFLTEEQIIKYASIRSAMNDGGK